MDKITRDLISMLFRRQNELAAEHIEMMKLAIKGRDESNKAFKLVGEVMKLVSRLNDPEKIRAAIDEAWTSFDQSESQDQQLRLIAKCESQHDYLSAGIESLLKTLESDDYGSNDDPIE